MTQAEFIRKLKFLSAHFPANQIPDLNRSAQTYYQYVEDLDDNHIRRVFNSILEGDLFFPVIAKFIDTIRKTERFVPDERVDELRAEGVNIKDFIKSLDSRNFVVDKLGEEPSGPALIRNQE